MDRATAVLESAVTDRTAPDLRDRIIELCEMLFHSIGLQSSVKKYYASGEERGAVLDFIDYPLNNRWWLEDQFKLIRAMKSEEEQHRKLREIAVWEHPGPGSFYDDIGNIAKSPHVTAAPEPTFLVVGSGHEPRASFLANHRVAHIHGLRSAGSERDLRGAFNRLQSGSAPNQRRARRSGD